MNTPLLTRRAFVAAACLASAPAAGQQAQTGALAFLQAVLQDGMRFDPAVVTEAARQLARRAYIAPTTTLPDPFNGLNFETYVGIRHRPERLIWSDESRPMHIEPLHRGYLFNTPVSISVVENGMVRRIAYDPGRYQFGRLQPPSNLPDLGFSGFRVMTAGENPREIAIFQGATFFRSLAKGQSMGAMARAMAIRTADARGEEFPIFRAFWIERPTNDGVLVVHAVADSESATAAFRFTIRPNDVTIVDTEATVFTRVVVDHIGFSPMQATFLFAANRRRNVDDMRPAVHEVNGLQMLNGRGEWIWRPVSNPEQLQISSFVDENPRGFGLMQRERDFAAFHDDDQQFQLRPSLWIEPIGEWGPGFVQLVEIPSDSEVNDNIIAYWRPRQPLAAGSETSFAYRQFWCWTTPERPPLATTIGFRIGRGSGGRRRRFLVEFAGGYLGQEHPTEGRFALSASLGQIINPRLIFDHGRKTARVVFELDPGNESAVELRLLLEGPEGPLSETWLYRWTP
ncbi:MAG: glucan biosynthesis protein [Beijerinckiaceae bacterium]